MARARAILCRHKLFLINQLHNMDQSAVHLRRDSGLERSRSHARRLSRCFAVLRSGTSRAHAGAHRQIVFVMLGSPSQHADEVSEMDLDGADFHQRESEAGSMKATTVRPVGSNGLKGQKSS